MSNSRFITTQYSADHFVESAGAVLFHVSKRQICLLYHQKRNEWLLAKGRRNISEDRAVTAVREIIEETGFECDLLHLTMVTRAPPAEETLDHYPDEPRTHVNVSEPFMVTCRHLQDGRNLKIIWWYMAAIRESNDSGMATKGEGEDAFKAGLFDFKEAVARLTYKLDQDIVSRAIEIFEANNMTTEVSDVSTTASKG